MNFLNKLIGRQSSIPKIIHYVWVGDKKLTDNNLELIKTWKKHNPEYKIICWNNDNIDLKNRYIRNALLLKNYANVSNLVRMMAVYEHGGIYLDTDIKCLKSFNPLLDQACFFGHCIKEKNSDWVNNAIFGATKKHWFIKNMINNISKLYDGAEAANLSQDCSHQCWLIWGFHITQKIYNVLKIFRCTPLNTFILTIGLKSTRKDSSLMILILFTIGKKDGNKKYA